MALQKNDFIEIEFTGKIKDGEVFDSNIPEELKKLNPNKNAKPFVFPLGQDMFLKGIEQYLMGKEVGSYEIELSPKDAFGFRDPALIQMIPMRVFIEHKINPVPGAVLTFDNRFGKVLTVSGGRVMIDFNGPLAGKDVVYTVKVSRKVEDINEKIKALIEFLFRRELKYKIQDKKVILNVDKGFKNFAELFKDKFKEILDLELEVHELESLNKEKEDK
jgi:FKBP-type peptidyl-prolyl cis-trans isomerase 2